MPITCLCLGVVAIRIPLLHRKSPSVYTRLLIIVEKFSQVDATDNVG